MTSRHAMDWMDIASAPKGKEILVYSPLCGGTMSVEDWGLFSKYNNPIWTHWMPLPSPPKESK